MFAKRISRQLRVALRESQMPLWQLAKRAGVDVTEAAAALGGNVVVPAQVLENVAQALGLQLELISATPLPRQVGPVRSLVDDALERLTPGQAPPLPNTADITVLALGFEGTLVLNTATPVARPGLLEFLQCVRGLFPRVAVFTALPEPQFRKIAQLLMAEGEAPDWFGGAEYVSWRGPAKDLAFIVEASPQQVLLVDSKDVQVRQDQLDRWIQVEPLRVPASSNDNELSRILQVLVDRLVA